MRVVFPCKGCGRDITAEYTRPGKTAQCGGCHMTQEIPGDAPAPVYTPQTGGGGSKPGGGGSKLFLIILVLAAAAAAWFFVKGRFF